MFYSRHDCTYKQLLTHMQLAVRSTAEMSLLLLCVSVICTTSAAGSYNYGHPLLMNAKTAAKGLPQPHNIHKRQADIEQDICYAKQVEDICTSGYYEDYAYVVAQCNRTGLAIEIQDSCRSNSKGDICGIFGIDSQRFESECGSPPTTCSSECRELLTTTRAEWGCCMNIFNSSNSDFSSDWFRYSLWSLCGVEPVTEQCAPSSFNLPKAVDPTCTERELDERLHSHVLCRREYIESQGALDSCSEEIDLERTCSVNRQGVYCNALPSFNFLQTIAYTICRDTSTCDPLCIATLNNITDTIGCCFITEFNSTMDTTRLEYLSYEFWQRCGLTSPGFCAVRLTDGPRISDAAAIITASEMMVSFLALLVIVFAFLY